MTTTDLYVNDRAGEPGAPLVAVVHGVMDRSASFGRVGRHLRDLHLLTYDRRGYGRSLLAGTANVPAHVDDLLAVLDGRPATVFGHSYGGLVAMAAAVRKPDVVRSVLAFEPPTPWLAWWPDTTEEQPEDPGDQAEAFLRAVVGDRLWERLPTATRELRRAEGVALRADLASLAGDAPFDPVQIRVPVTVAHGSATTWWHERAVRDLAAAVPGAELAVVQGAQHGVHLSHPTALSDLIRDAVGRAGTAATHR